MSNITWKREQGKINPITVIVHDAKVLKISNSNDILNDAPIEIENKNRFQFIPKDSIEFFVDAKHSTSFVIEVKEEVKDGYHAKFRLGNYNSHNDMYVDLKPETAEISFIDDEDGDIVVRAQICNNKYDKAKYDWVFAHITELFHFVLIYADIMISKYEQNFYINEWGENVIEQPFWQAVGKLLGKFYDEYHPYKLKEYAQLQKFAISSYFPDNYHDDSEGYKVIFTPADMNESGDKDFVRAIIEKNQSAIDIQYFPANANLNGVDWNLTDTVYYGDSGVVFGIVSALAKKMKQNNKKTKQNNKDISPLDYEKQIAVRLKDLGFNAHATKASGDQGADVLADKQGIKFAIQCKMYSKPVGNKAVQEVNAARDYYKCDYGVVITNSSYTPAARKAANACGVILLNDNQLEKLLEYV